jgi:hypothetical protein
MPTPFAVAPAPRSARPAHSVASPPRTSLAEQARRRRPRFGPRKAAGAPGARPGPRRPLSTDVGPLSVDPVVGDAGNRGVRRRRSPARPPTGVRRRRTPRPAPPETRPCSPTTSSASAARASAGTTCRCGAGSTASPPPPRRPGQGRGGRGRARRPAVHQPRHEGQGRRPHPRVGALGARRPPRRRLLRRLPPERPPLPADDPAGARRPGLLPMHLRHVRQGPAPAGPLARPGGPQARTEPGSQPQGGGGQTVPLAGIAVEVGAIGVGRGQANR